MTAVRKRQIVLLLAVLVLAFNAVMWVLVDRADSGGSLLTSTGVITDQLVLATGDGADGVVTVSRDNEVVKYRGDLQPQGTFTVEDTIGAVAARADGTVVIGTTNGSVTQYDPNLTPGPTTTVDGRVLALAVNDDGTWVAHGVGAFGVRFYISLFPPAATEPSFTYQVAQPVNAMIPWREGVVFGTGNSAVGYLAATSPDAPVWQVQLKAAISRLAPTADGEGILAGTERGELSLLGADGTEQWTTAIGQYAIRGLNADPTEFLVGDANGTFTQVDPRGSVSYSGSSGESSDLEAILPVADDQWVGIPRSGEWQQIDPAAASSATSAGNLRLAWSIGNGVLVLLTGGAIISVIDPWRKLAVHTLRQAWKSRVAYLFALPAIGFILLFSYYPAAMSFYYSLTNYSLRSVTRWVGLDNYENILFNDPYFRIGVQNMLVITITSVIKTLTVPLLIAELIFWLRNHWHSYVFRTLFILPTVVPGLVFTLMWRQIYDPDTGLINELLGIIGLEQWQTAWLGNPDTALWAIIGVGFPWVDAFALLILLGGLLNINGDYFDAAKVDGASVWQRFRNIDLPLLVPQFRILLFFAITGTIQGFVSIFVLTRGGPGMTTYIPALQMYMRISDGDFGYASAVGVILFLVILVATFVVLRIRRNDGVEGA
jgi:ABC-type sugar transport system permease subunit